MIYIRSVCIYIFLFFSLFKFNAFSQNARQNRTLNIDFSYLPAFSSLEAKKRFGFLNFIGGGIRYKTQKTWQWGAEGAFIFGSSVKSSAINFSGIVHPDGYFINENGQQIQAKLFGRGWLSGVQFGVFKPLNQQDKNSGLLYQTAIGYIRNKIRIEFPGEGVNQLSGLMKMGYDKLHAGIYVRQFLGYQFMQPRYHYVNFLAGFDFLLCATQSLRKYNYDTKSYDNTNKIEAYWGLKFTWFIPRYLAFRDGNDEYYFK